MAVASATIRGLRACVMCAVAVGPIGALDSAGSFSMQLPGTTRVVTLTATDRQGTTETIVSGVERQNLRSGTTAAEAALGVRVVKVRFYKQNVLRRHFMRMVVTVRDRRGLSIQGAKISVRPAKAGRLSHRPKMHLSGRKGQATFTLRLRKAALGKRLIVATVAATPKAKTTKRSAVFVPRAKTKTSR